MCLNVCVCVCLCVYVCVSVYTVCTLDEANEQLDDCCASYSAVF